MVIYIISTNYHFILQNLMPTIEVPEKDMLYDNINSNIQEQFKKIFIDVCILAIILLFISAMKN